MGIKDVNRIFGYAYFIVGVAKIILIVLLFTQLLLQQILYLAVTNIIAI